MSFSLTPSDCIRKHPTNHSTAKEAHAFAKQERFPAPNPECPNAFYSFDSQLSQRKAALGYGDKSDYTRTLTCSPPATRYSLRTFVDQVGERGATFGTGRDKLPDRSYLVPQLQRVPGPGQYQNDKPKRCDFRFTVRPKPVDMIEENLTYKEAPGPGTHTDLDFHPKNGRYAVSKYGDSAFCTIHPKTERFPRAKQTPGPCSYHEGDSLNGEARYVLSNRKSNGRRAFSRSARGSPWRTTSTPGPGSYREASQFGHYGDQDYYKKLKK